MYSVVKKALKSSGELMVQMADGQTFELHTHNTDFEDDTELLVIDSGDKKYWLDGNQVIYFWLHRGAME